MKVPVLTALALLTAGIGVTAPMPEAQAAPDCQIPGANAWCEPMPGTPMGDYMEALNGESPTAAYLGVIEYPGGPPYPYGETVRLLTPVPVADASIACTQLRGGWGTGDVIDAMTSRGAVASREDAANVIFRMVRPLCFDQVANLHDQMMRPDLVALDPAWTHHWIHAPGSLTRQPG